MSAKIWKISKQKAISCGRLPLETQYVFECMFPEGIFLAFVQKDAKKPAILIFGRIFTIYSQIIHKPPPPGGMDTAASGSSKKNWKERKEKGF